MSETKTFPMLCGSVAGKASKLGVALHEAGYRALGLECRYVAVGTDDLDAAIGGMRALCWRGFGVSMPFKISVLSCLDELAEEVKTIGACNTVVNEGGRLHGYNTDWRGALDALGELGVDMPRSVLIVGAGGVARAIAYGLASTGARVTVACRTRSAGEKICLDLGLAGCIGLNEQGAMEFDLIVNATPIASLANSAVDIRALSRAKSLLDVVFSPRDTELASHARELGLRVAPGWRMLLHQAAHQFRLYTGCGAPLEAMEPVLRDALS